MRRLRLNIFGKDTCGLFCPSSEDPWCYLGPLLGRKFDHSVKVASTRFLHGDDLLSSLKLTSLLGWHFETVWLSCSNNLLLSGLASIDKFYQINSNKICCKKWFSSFTVSPTCINCHSLLWGWGIRDSIIITQTIFYSVLLAITVIILYAQIAPDLPVGMPPSSCVFLPHSHQSWSMSLSLEARCSSLSLYIFCSRSEIHCFPWRFASF